MIKWAGPNLEDPISWIPHEKYISLINESLMIKWAGPNQEDPISWIPWTNTNIKLMRV